MDRDIRIMFHRETGEGEKLKEEKLEQLREVFKRMIKKFLNSNPDDEDYYNTENDYIKTLANNLVYEVKIRINNK